MVDMSQDKGDVAKKEVAPTRLSSDHAKNLACPTNDRVGATPHPPANVETSLVGRSGAKEKRRVRCHLCKSLLEFSLPPWMEVQSGIVNVTCGKCKTELSVALRDRDSILQSIMVPNAPISFKPSITGLQAEGLRLPEGLALLEKDILAAIASTQEAIAHSMNPSLQDLLSSIGQFHSEAPRQERDTLSIHPNGYDILHRQRAVQAHQQQQVQTPFSHYPLIPVELQGLLFESKDMASRRALLPAEDGRHIQTPTSAGLLELMRGTISNEAQLETLSSSKPLFKQKNREKRTRQPSPYNLFMRNEILKIKELDSSIDHRTAFKQAAQNWMTSTERKSGKGSSHTGVTPDNNEIHRSSDDPDMEKASLHKAGERSGHMELEQDESTAKRLKQN